MDERVEPTFTVPRELLRAVAEVDAAYGWLRLPVLHEPRVLDVGAGEGAFTVVASQVWPGARFHCFEPEPERFAALTQNTRGLPVECTNRLDAATLGPTDVLRVDAQGSDLSPLAPYPHWKTLSVLLVTGHGEAVAAQARAIATSAGLTAVGQHSGSGGRATVRFVRTELLTRDAVELAPTIPGDGPRTEASELRPVTFGEQRLHLYVSMVAGSGKAWSDVEHGLHHLGVLCLQRRIGLTLVREKMTGVDRARNVQTERCLDLVRNAAEPDKPTHMLQLDSDLVFKPEDILRLMRSNLDVTAIVYPRKEIDWDRVFRAVHAGVPAAELSKYAASFVVNFAGASWLRHPELGTFVEVEEVGTGCLMTKVGALARYVEAYREELEYVTDYDPLYAVHHQVFHCERDPACAREVKLRELKRAARALLRATEGDGPAENSTEPLRAALLDAGLAWGRTVDDPTSIGRYLTEDYSFCRRWRLLGGKIYALLEGELGHVGKHIYRGTLERAVPVRDLPGSKGRE